MDDSVCFRAANSCKNVILSPIQDLGVAPANIAEPSFNCAEVDKVPKIFNMTAAHKQ